MPLHELVAAADAASLLSAVAHIHASTNNLAGRRAAMLAKLCEIMEADAGFWSWGRGHPIKSTIVPVAILDFGYTAQEKGKLIEWGLDPEIDKTFRHRVISRLIDRPQLTVTRQDVFPNEEWAMRPLFRIYQNDMGMDPWMETVRYSGADTWSGIFLSRRIGQPEFDVRSVALLDLAMLGIPWLHAYAEEILPPEAFVGLTPRQRIVMLMLLDGLSRRDIATQLSVSENTVSDHIKCIYQHFQVHSVSELAAQFLRNG